MGALLSMLAGRIVVGVALALGLAAGVQTLRLNAARNVGTELRLVLEHERRQAAETAAAAQEARRLEERRRTISLGKINAEAQDRGRAGRLGAARAGDAADQLRERAAATAAGCRGAAGDPAAAIGRAPAADAGTLLADVLGRAVQAARELAATADERGTAGQACERAWDALTPP